MLFNDKKISLQGLEGKSRVKMNSMGISVNISVADFWSSIFAPMITLQWNAATQSVKRYVYLDRDFFR